MMRTCTDSRAITKTPAGTRVTMTGRPIARPNHY
jgi:hypothetical protein